MFCFLCLHLSGFSVPTCVGTLIARNLLFIVMNVTLVVTLLRGSWCCNDENHTNTAWLRIEPLDRSSNILHWTFSLGLEEQIPFTCFSCLVTLLLAVGTEETTDHRDRCRVPPLLCRLFWSWWSWKRQGSHYSGFREVCTVEYKDWWDKSCFTSSNMNKLALNNRGINLTALLTWGFTLLLVNWGRTEAAPSNLIQ